MRWDRITALSIAGFGAIASHLWGGADEILILLVTLMSLDYVLGIMCAYKNNNLSSAIGFRGIAKKVTILIVVALAVSVDLAIGADGAIRAMIILFYVGMEGVSILENAVVMGVEVPDKLETALIQLQDGNKKSSKKEDGTLE